MGSYNSFRRQSVGAVCPRALFGIGCLFSALLVTALSAGLAFGEPIHAVLQPTAEPDLLRDPNSYTLAQINAAGGIIIGDKLFDSFDLTATQQGGALAPNATGIAIRPIQVLKPGAPLGGDYGMTFSAGWLAFDQQIVDTTIEFRASILPAYAAQGYAFKDNALWISAVSVQNTTNGGVAISENLFASHPGLTTMPFASEVAYYHSPTNQQLQDSATFAPIVEMWVVKDVAVSGGIGTAGVAHLSEFYQTFSQVPEPGTLVLLVIGAVALGGYAWRKRCGRAGIDAA